MLNFDAKFKNLTFGTHQISFVDEDKNNFDVIIEVGKPKNREKNNGIKIGTNRPPYYLTINSTMGDYKLRVSYGMMQYVSKMTETSNITKIIPILVNGMIKQKDEDRKINVIKKYMKDKYNIDGSLSFLSTSRGQQDGKTYYEFFPGRGFGNGAIQPELVYILIRFGIMPVYFENKNSHMKLSYRFIITINFDEDVNVDYTENDNNFFKTIP